jgi:hypothetical protein
MLILNPPANERDVPSVWRKVTVKGIFDESSGCAANAGDFV